MVVDDLQFVNIFIGKRVKLTLKSSSYVGVIKRINPNKTVVLVDVACGSDGGRTRSRTFYGHEILNVEFASEGNADGGDAPEPKPEANVSQPYQKLLNTGDDEDEEFINFEVIDSFHEKFGAAVMHIRRQQVVGVGTDGIEVCKNGRLCWLQIATKNKVYLFDILLLGAQAFKNGLSMILENKNILKVMHDCRTVAGCLAAQFGVKLSNVFDTQVADVMCFYSVTGGFLPSRVSTLQEVASLHLKMPSYQLLSLQMKSELTKEGGEMWYKRPPPVSVLKAMALSVIHLQPLRLVLLDTLMSDYMALVDSYLSSSHYLPDDLEHITMESVLELPSELRQLEQMRRERRECAAKRYPVTVKGLLDRFSPQTRSASKSSPDEEDHSGTQPGSSLPEDVQPATLTQADLLLHLSPNSPARVPDVSSARAVDVSASP